MKRILGTAEDYRRLYGEGQVPSVTRKTPVKKSLAPAKTTKKPTTKKPTAKKAPTKKAPVKKAPARKTAAKLNLKKADKPDFEIITTEETWLQIANGVLSPLRAFLQVPVFF